jgi:hypothetical protein
MHSAASTFSLIDPTHVMRDFVALPVLTEKQGPVSLSSDHPYLLGVSLLGGVARS